MSKFDLSSTIFNLKILTSKSIIESINIYSEQLKNIKNLDRCEINSELVKELFKLKIKTDDDNFQSPLKKMKPNILIENIDNFNLEIDQQIKIKLMNNLTKNEDLIRLKSEADQILIQNQLKENKELVEFLRDLINNTIEFINNQELESNEDLKKIDQKKLENMKIFLPKKLVKTSPIPKASPSAEKIIEPGKIICRIDLSNLPSTSRTTRSKMSKQSLAVQKNKGVVDKEKTTKFQKSKPSRIPSIKNKIESDTENSEDSSDSALSNQLAVNYISENKTYFKFELCGVKKYLKYLDREYRSQEFRCLDTLWAVEVYSSNQKKKPKSERFLVVGLDCKKRENTKWQIKTNFEIGIENQSNGSDVKHFFKDCVYEYHDERQMHSEDQFISYAKLEEEGFIKDDKIIFYCELTAEYLREE